MKLMNLKGHSRALTHIVISREGDLLFTASKDHSPLLWDLEKGERIGSYDGHDGTVWYIDVDSTCTYMLSASADSTTRIWDVKTGKQGFSISHKSPARVCSFGTGDKVFLTVTDNVLGESAQIIVWKLDEKDPLNNPPTQVASYKTDEKIFHALFNNNNKEIVFCCDKYLKVLDASTMTSMNVIKTIDEFKKPVSQVQFDPYNTFMIACSQSGVAKLYNARTYECLRTYTTGIPIDTASISPIRNHIITGGGQSSMTVTNTNVDNSQFSAIIFDLSEESELGRCPGHFGPIHTSAFFPDGSGFATGGEDGYCRVWKFDDQYNLKNFGY